jgi:lysophospholipase L1-like esterase
MTTIAPGTPVNLSKAIHASRHAPGGADDLSSTYRQRKQPTLVCIGDSIVGKGDGPGSPGTGLANVSYHTDGYWTHALNLLGGRMRFLSNLGVGGTTSTQALATVPAALALNPGFILENTGINDLGLGGGTVASITANKTAIWNAIEAGGARPIASTITPLATYTGGEQAMLEAVNIWIRDQARVRKDLILIDPYACVVNPIGGTIQSALTSDGTHPNAVGAFLIGKQLAAALSPYLPPTNTELCSSEGDSTNLIATASRFATGGSGAVNTDTAGHFSDHMSATTYSKEDRTDGIAGAWQVFTVADGATAGGWLQFNVAVGATVAIGDSVIASVEYDISSLDQAAAASSQGFNLRVQSYNGSASANIIYDQYWINGTSANMSAQPRAGVLRTPPIVVPAGCQILLVLIQMYGGGTYKLDRTTLLNVTQRALTGN